MAGEDSDQSSVDATAPGVQAPHRSAALYNPATGKLDIKKLGAWIAAAITLVTALSAGGSRVGGWAKWWLDIDMLERRVTSCEARVEELNRDVHPDPAPRNANARLTEALPRISTALRDAQKERQSHEQAITRLTTIHEFGLTRANERQAAQEARRSVVWRHDAPSGAGGTGPPSIEALAGM